MKQKRIGYSAKTLAEWFQEKRPDAKVSVMEWSETKTTKPVGNPYTTGGGTRDYDGYKIEIEVDDDRLVHCTTETYRKNTEIVDFMLKHLSLENALKE